VRRAAFFQTLLDMLASPIATAARDLAMRSSIFLGVRGLHKHAPSRVPTRGKKSMRVRSGDRGGHEIGPRRPSIFLDLFRSTTAGHLPHSVLELHRVETTTSASQLEAQHQAPSAEMPRKLRYL
jgi:hypothetical protein